jgi:hypothetical protein
MKTRNNNYPLFIETLSPKKERKKPTVERDRENDTENKRKKKKIKNMKKIINSYIII